MAEMATLHQMIFDKEFVLAPGAYDCLTAGAIQRSGFNAVYMTGSGVRPLMATPISAS